MQTILNHSRLILAALLTAILLPHAPLAAGFVGPGTQATITTARGALSAADDAPCVLEGNIVSRVPSRKNRYLFSDATGQIVVEIKKKVFGQLTVTPQNHVRLEGEVDFSRKHPNEVEVDSIAIIE